MRSGAAAQAMPMITLFFRSIFMYIFVFVVLRLTGKRQVSDLQPFDLLITLLIADLAGCAIADPGTPLVYSIVPILGMFLTQQLVTFLCLKSVRVRRLACGSPVILVRDGVLQESAMRDNDYTVIDLLDQLRSQDVFDLRQVAFAILETNGSMSVLQKGEFQTPTMSDMGLQPGSAELTEMLILDGESCHDAMARLNMNEKQVEGIIRSFGKFAIEDVFFLHHSPDEALLMQLKERAGGTQFSRGGKKHA